MTFRNFFEDNCPDHAASLTYTTLFAIVPLLTVTYSILASFPTFHGTGVEIQQFIFSHFVPSAGETVSEWLTSFSSQARNLTLIGMGFLVATALMMLRTIDSSINTIFHSVGARRPMTSFLLYWMILTLGPLLLGLGFAATSYLTTIKFLDHATTTLGLKGLVLQLFPILMSFSAFTLLYLAVPNRRVNLRHAMAGGVFVALMFELTKQGFALFLTLSPTYEFIYGAFAAVPVFLLWIFLSWLIVLLGAELVHALGEPSGEDRQPFSPMLAMLTILAVFHERFTQGKTTMLENVQQDGWPVSQRDWEAVARWLISEELLVRNSHGALMPARAFSAVDLASLVSRCPWPIPESRELEALSFDDRPDWFRNIVGILQGLNEERGRVLSGSLEHRLSDGVLLDTERRS
ncbi:YihY family inner membrane protein [Parendozoicomonas haliclonae]|nr:YihY family inner membrane protein [Parendozoicomonas haliclonae]